MLRQACAIAVMLCFLFQVLPELRGARHSTRKDDLAIAAQFARDSGMTATLAASPVDPAAMPPALFSMTVQSGIFSGTPWPSVPIVGIRLWDTYTNWNHLESSRGTYNWPALDRWLDQAQAHGTDVLYTFGGTPTWASANPTGKCDYVPGGCYPPANMQDWDDFVRAIAVHAGGRIKYWETWNEANQREYWSGGIPALVTMTQHAYMILKSINPNAKVFTPSGVGGAADTSTFLDQFFAAGGGAFVDGVAFHGYVNSVPPSPEEVNRIVDAVEGVMVKRGQGGKPVWDTEGSWGVSNRLPNEDDQVAFVARYLVLQWSKGVQRLYWYAWNDATYGTLWDVGTHKICRPGIAYGEVGGWLTGAAMSAPCVMASDSTWTCGLTLTGGARAQIVWNTSNSSASSSTGLPFRPDPVYVQYKSLEGGTMPISNGTILIGSKPLLLLSGGSPALIPPRRRRDPAKK
jgi:hypothetical protein